MPRSRSFLWWYPDLPIYAVDNLCLKDAFKIDRFYGGILAFQVLFLTYASDTPWLKNAFKVDRFLGVAKYCRWRELEPEKPSESIVTSIIAAPDLKPQK
ncbi:MAG: hypothetical protein JGK32_33435 [Microcoleus sp. PH2017_31_RDM_U_A]|uniref:hypothetical protein n=1 Tax=Microcoleus sp. PH2017_32_RDM_D_A TaxID=2798842 RepID=UPI001D37D0BC|nr:hypothetical protein [Microcoleus sp. PH2017_32_RDM_D_A]MCC3507575.1 hypothetical protein [Microcoleus sp. PH2017_17_BER_D_A]MCC3570102.1 hypothetical protein [Microcoleus sp. PH2017_31_RDM_U_A]